MENFKKSADYCDFLHWRGVRPVYSLKRRAKLLRSENPTRRLMVERGVRGSAFICSMASWMRRAVRQVRKSFPSAEKYLYNIG